MGFGFVGDDNRLRAFTDRVLPYIGLLVKHYQTFLKYQTLTEGCYLFHLQGLWIRDRAAARAAKGIMENNQFNIVKVNVFPFFRAVRADCTT